ncbi:hypothetical protein [Candidatus Methylopumilus planktonicus]|uniref:hypothetical protein n=1 Tax=Candidatus Methylopumilus planktonicus TaxID=1581557 RepID=UPI003BEED1D4
MSLDNPFILRRLKFIKLEAINNSERDQTTTFAMRVISNFGTIGMNGSSSKILRINKNMSESAFNELRKSKTIQDWIGKVTNEHPMPLKESWKAFQSLGDKLTEEYIWKHFVKYPMNTILKTENQKLDKLGYRDNGLPKLRYTDADISIFVLSDTPERWWYTQRMKND